MTPPIRPPSFVRSILAVVLTFPLAGLLLLGSAVEGEAAGFTAWTRFRGEINGQPIVGKKMPDFPSKEIYTRWLRARKF